MRGHVKCWRTRRNFSNSPERGNYLESERIIRMRRHLKCQRNFSIPPKREKCLGLRRVCGCADMWKARELGETSVYRPKGESV